MEAGYRQPALPAPGTIGKYLIEEGEIRKNPMANMKPPTDPEARVRVISDDDLAKMLA